MPIKKYYLGTSIAIVLLLCLTQIRGSTMLTLICLAAFLVLLGWGCFNNFTLPILLFFLPWSPIMRMTPTGYSFFTFGLVLVCAISFVKKRFRFKKYHIAVGVILLFLSLLSKLIDGNGLTFDYIAFLMLIVLFPVVKEEWKAEEYDFFQTVTFFSMGIIIAALCALNFAVYPNIKKYIRVDSYLTIIRRSGFYGDANFYTAQITAALGGGLSLILKEKKKGHTIFLGILVFFLLYCGFLSGSKSFVIVSVCVLGLWLIAFLRMRGRTGLKVILLICILLLAIYIATSVMFSGLIDVLITRFSYSRDLESFTTGRIGLWQSYFEEIMGNSKVFFFGRGFTNVKVNGRASHNTIIQSFYQFGLLGVPLLLYWIISFYRDHSSKVKMQNVFTLRSLLVITGVFLPWLAIDMLFFDDFFLLQWYSFIALQQPESHKSGDTKTN